VYLYWPGLVVMGIGCQETQNSKYLQTKDTKNIGEAT
jgi:hypothetical protein